MGDKRWFLRSMAGNVLISTRNCAQQPIDAHDGWATSMLIGTTFSPKATYQTQEDAILGHKKATEDLCELEDEMFSYENDRAVDKAARKWRQDE